MTVAIVDYGAGNTRSVMNALSRLDIRCRLSADKTVLEAASHIILPGVGAAGAAMEALTQAGLTDWLRQCRKPMLGVCLGMQLFYDYSAEGDTACLGLIPGRVEALPRDCGPIPHMGWNQVRAIGDHALLRDVDLPGYFYFAHGFFRHRGAETIALCDYGSVSFSAVVRHGHIFAAQFHPEKSGPCGARLLANFVTLQP